MNLRPVLAFFGFSALAVAAWPIASESQSQPSEQPLPAELIVEAQDRQVYQIAIPNFAGNTALGAMATEVLRNDFRYSGVARVIDQRQYPASATREGLGIERRAWTGIGANAVVKVEMRPAGREFEIEARLYEVGRIAGNEPTFTRTLRASESEVRATVHRLANDLVGQLTGKPGAFDTRLVFIRKPTMGRKDVMLVDYDGANLARVTNGEGIAMLPSFGRDSLVWYSRLTPFGMYITNTRASDRPVVESDGLNMGVTVCDDRMYFTSSRDGNAEIYSAKLDGSDMKRLTNHPSIDVSPTCGPNDQLAFVSNRQGSPQIYVMSRNGGDARRVTFKGSHNQTPSFCQDASQPLIAFTGRDDGQLDVFTVNVNTGAYTRITQAQGLNKDPSFSPDCRMIAFHSSRQGGGVYLSNQSGFNQNRVLDGHAETIRWEPRAGLTQTARTTTP